MISGDCWRPKAFRVGTRSFLGLKKWNASTNCCLSIFEFREIGEPPTQDNPMLNWHNTTLDIVRAFPNFHATPLLAFKIAAAGRQQLMSQRVHPPVVTPALLRND
jgi:hypothetical protein